MGSKLNDKILGIQEKAMPVLKKYPIQKAGLFGSVVRDEEKKNSDIDILVEIVPGVKLSLFDYIGIQSALEDALERKVDMVQYKSVKPALKQYILPNEIRIYDLEFK